ncbi:HTH-type transcriptional regulator SrpS [Aquimixticola soesokkakensis]|uniref:HTH-type transcriptional regulator SrpS n=1 Tax=Aquimixticola soesokkakensis TaxID=1519096 RepID=A0A1Y5RRT8_9RHOB|nr:IclR family transcriptional regulator [Aquimixticola soesokkakensis]SLN22770.1 HTH-type transcriptional regulator SrpS [Aquimixticola soesokkakensis]
MSEKTRATDGQSISRAVAVLRAIGARPGASLGEIAKETGLARSTVQRLVGALNNEGLVTKNFGQQGVFLGMELARLGAQVNLDARTILAPMMDELHQQIGDNIDLTVFEGDRVIVIDQKASNESIRVVSHVGKEHPIHATANGKAHLSQLTRAEAEALLPSELPAFTAKTFTERARLLDQVEAFGQLGLYIDREEFSLEACAIATTLPPFGGRKLAVAIAMPSARFARREEDLKSALLAFRRAVQERFGASI